MLGVILDQGSIGEDVDYSPLFEHLDQWKSHSITVSDDIFSRIKHADVVVTNKIKLHRDLLQQCTQLKLICVAATGTNNIDLQAARDVGISVCNVKGYATPSVVEHTFALMLSLSRQLNAYQQDVSQGAWQKSPHFCLLDHPISELAGKRLGIIGYGELGQAVASVAKAFGMEVLVAKSLHTSAEQPDRLALDELLGCADVVSIHCPLSRETTNLIDERRLSLMKKSSLLINTARGGVVDEKALYHALVTGQIAGAATDVLVVEPPTDDNVLLAANLPNLIVTPHIAWASQQARQRLVNEIALNIQAYLRGEPRNIV